jgi:hypothetical protein
MYKTIITACLAVFIWVLPAPSMAALQPEHTLVWTTLEDIDPNGITLASGRFSVHIGPRGTFAFGSFGGRGFHKFGGRGFHKFGGPGFHKFGGPGFHKFGRKGFHPHWDPFFYDRYSRFAPGYGFSSPYHSPFGTRRPGW